MKTAFKISVSFGFLLSAILLTSFISREDKTKETEATSENASEQNGFALVELFTSEGCSSCPPADELVARVQEENAGKPVYILAYHVDYWDFQGWRDVFSNQDFTKRQYQYASWLKTESVYTPQIVVNGKQEFVGSEQTSLKNAINEGLESSASAKLSLDATAGKNKIAVHYQTDQVRKNVILQLALVQKIAQTTVKRGENAGRQLSHVQIVHQLQSQSIQATGAGDAEVSIPVGFDTKNWELIGFLQNKRNGEVLATAKPAFKENI